MIQRRSARYVTNRYFNTSSIESMLHKLKWPTLEERRKNARLTLLYKISNEEVKVDAGDKLIPPDRLSRHECSLFPNISMQVQHQERVLISTYNKRLEHLACLGDRCRKS